MFKLFPTLIHLPGDQSLDQPMTPPMHLQEHLHKGALRIHVCTGATMRLPSLQAFTSGVHGYLPTKPPSDHTPFLHSPLTPSPAGTLGPPLLLALPWSLPYCLLHLSPF